MRESVPLTRRRTSCFRELLLRSERDAQGCHRYALWCWYLTSITVCFGLRGSRDGPPCLVFPVLPCSYSRPTQDAYTALAPYAQHPTQLLLGVYDGHGANGRPVAHAVRSHISTTLTALYSQITSNSPSISSLGVSPSGGFSAVSPPSSTLSLSTTSSDAKLRKAELPRAPVHAARAGAMRTAFLSAEAMLSTLADGGVNSVFSGTTAVACWLHGAELYTAWSGDSRAIIGRKAGSIGGRQRFQSVDLSWDQKPCRADERKRVKASGGRVARWRKNVGPLRVWLPRDWLPGIAMTRSIGDTVVSGYGVVAEPEVSYLRLSRGDDFIVLASDGVWEFMTSQEVVDYVGRHRRDSTPPAIAADALVKEAVRRWRRNEMVVDDTTAVVVYLDWGEDGLGGGGGVAGTGSPSMTGGVGVEKGTAGGVGRFHLPRRGGGGGTGGAMGDKPALVGLDGRLHAYTPKNDGMGG